MSQSFAEVVEEVRQLSSAEKLELHELLKKYLVEERRNEILTNYEVGTKELRKGELISFTTDGLMKSLSDD
jgi:hypothetical protein